MFDQNQKVVEIHLRVCTGQDQAPDLLSIHIVIDDRVFGQENGRLTLELRRDADMIHVDQYCIAQSQSGLRSPADGAEADGGQGAFAGSAHRRPTQDRVHEPDVPVPGLTCHIRHVVGKQRSVRHQILHGQFGRVVGQVRLVGTHRPCAVDLNRHIEALARPDLAFGQVGQAHQSLGVVPLRNRPLERREHRLLLARFTHVAGLVGRGEVLVCGADHAVLVDIRKGVVSRLPQHLEEGRVDHIDVRSIDEVVRQAGARTVRVARRIASQKFGSSRTAPQIDRLYAGYRG